MKKFGSIGLIVSIFSGFASCHSIKFFQLGREVTGRENELLYASSLLQDFNPRFFHKDSVYRSFLYVRRMEETGSDSIARVDRIDIQFLVYQPQFRLDLDRVFPNSNLPHARLEVRILSGVTIETPGPTGMEVEYSQERVRSVEGSGLEALWNLYQKAGFIQNSIRRTEKWESVKDGLWLAEESEETENTNFRWRHKPGSLDFLFPITEFRSPKSILASLHYDYNLVRFHKLKIEKKAEAGILVAKDSTGYLFLSEGQLRFQSIP